ncbi:MAG: DNA polymerase III subunit [Candidatus Omnitrophota bacterium]
MKLLSDIKSQAGAVRYLTGSLQSGRIASSYLFSGPEGVGRALCAKAFILALLCPEKQRKDAACLKCITCRSADRLEHPDIIWIKPEKNKAIRIGEIRKVKDALNLKPYGAMVSVCVIEDAHMMTSEASNALLKLLEEPPERSLLVLITNRKELLLETVVSRCSEVKFRHMSFEDTKSIIRENADLDAEAVSFLARFSQGSPGRALLMAAGDMKKRKDEVAGLLERIVKEKEAAYLVWDRDDRAGLIEDIDMMVMFFRDIMMGKAGLGDKVLDREIPDTAMYRFFEKYRMEELRCIIERLIDTGRALAGNTNPKLMAQALPGYFKRAMPAGIR